MKAKKPRLKKGPDINDFVVERIDQGKESLRTGYRYFMTRAEARAWVKFCLEDGATRTRVFRIKYTLVADSKRRKVKLPKRRKAVWK